MFVARRGRTEFKWHTQKADLRVETSCRHSLKFGFNVCDGVACPDSGRGAVKKLRSDAARGLSTSMMDGGPCTTSAEPSCRTVLPFSVEVWCCFTVGADDPASELRPITLAYLTLDFIFACCT